MPTLAEYEQFLRNSVTRPRGISSKLDTVDPAVVDQGNLAYATSDATFNFPEVSPNLIPLLSTPYVNPIEKTGEVAQFNTAQFEENFKLAERFADLLTNIEYTGLESFNRKARALQQEGIISENEFNRLQLMAANKFNLGEVSTANAANQSERLKQLEKALPGARDVILQNIERNATLAEGRFPGQLEDRAFEVAARNAAADITQAGGFGVGSAFGEKTSDLLSAEQRLQLSQTGQSNLSSFLNLGATLAFDQPIKYNPVLQEPIQARTSLDVRGAPSIPASQAAITEQGQLTPLTTISPTTAAQLEIGQNQFQTNIEQQANMFNSSLDFQGQTFNATGAWTEQIEQYMQDVFNSQQEANAINAQIGAEQAQTNFDAALEAGKDAAITSAVGQTLGAIAAPIASGLVSSIFKEEPSTEQTTTSGAKTSGGAVKTTTGEEAAPSSAPRTSTELADTFNVGELASVPASVYSTQHAEKPVEASTIGQAGVQMVGAYNDYVKAIDAGEKVPQEAHDAFNTAMTVNDAATVAYETTLSATRDAKAAQAAADAVIAQSIAATDNNQPLPVAPKISIPEEPGAVKIPTQSFIQTQPATPGETLASQSQVGTELTTFGAAMAVASIAIGAFNAKNELSSDRPGRPAGKGAAAGATSGAAIGAGVGSSVPVPGATILGAGIGAVVGGITGAIHTMTGSSKGGDQIYRDAIRDYGTEINLFFKPDTSQPEFQNLDSKHHYIRLADGTLYDIGRDGDNKLENYGVNIDGNTERNTYEVDHSDPRAAESIGYLNPLSVILFGPEGGSKIAGHLWNAATSNNETLSGTKENFRSFAAQTGVDYELGLSLLERYAQEGDITQAQFSAYVNGWNKLMLSDGVDQEILARKPSSYASAR